jgi:hypothetical protein
VPWNEIEQCRNAGYVARFYLMRPARGLRGLSDWNPGVQREQLLDCSSSALTLDGVVEAGGVRHHVGFEQMERRARSRVVF